MSDLLGYLRKKESLIIGGHLDRAFQEADMVAVYLTNIDQEGKHSFPQAADGSRLLVSNKAWGKLATHPQYMAKKEADRPSYVWDRIIEEFAKHTVQGSLVYNSPRSIAETEVGLRSMASESRFARRLLSNALRGVLEGVPAGQIGIRTVVSKDQRDITYVFVAMSNSGWPEDEFRLYRRDYLEKYCLVVASKHRSSQRFIGLATEAGLGPERSYDLICFEPGEWTVEKEAEARSIQDETKMFTRTTQRDVHDEEYPQLLGVQIRPPNPVTARVGRNDPCPCGSGKKYKRCCLR